VCVATEEVNQEEFDSYDLFTLVAWPRHL
jgi:hypothetical protein